MIELSYGPGNSVHEKNMAETSILTFPCGPISTAMHSWLSESHFLRQSKAGAEHPLLWRYIPDVPDGDLVIAGLYFMLQLLGDLLADRDPLSFIVVALSTEAIDMNHWQLSVRMRSEHRFLPTVKTNEIWQERYGGCWQIHDIVVEDLRLREYCRS